MELRERLAFDDARIVEVANYPSERGVKCVLVLAASLLSDRAGQLGCGYIYRDGIPVADLDGVKLELQLRDMELHLPASHDRQQYDVYYPELIHKFAIARVDDAKFEVRFRVHEASRRADLLMLLESVNKDEFEIAIRPRQGELFDGGTRVEMSSDATEAKDDDEPPLFACPLCDEEVPLDDSGTQHVDADGVVSECLHPSAKAVAALRTSSRGTVASKRQMANV